MSAGRPNLAQEKILWAIALAHFGPSELHKVVSDIWSEAKPPDRLLVETLDISIVGTVVLNVLKTAQAEIGATVPHRQPGPGQVVMYSRHAQLLTDGLLDRIPAKQLPRDLRGFKVQVAMGV